MAPADTISPRATSAPSCHARAGEAPVVDRPPECCTMECRGSAAPVDTVEPRTTPAPSCDPRAAASDVVNLRPARICASPSDAPNAETLCCELRTDAALLGRTGSPTEWHETRPASTKASAAADDASGAAGESTFAISAADIRKPQPGSPPSSDARTAWSSEPCRTSCASPSECCTVNS